MSAELQSALRMTEAELQTAVTGMLTAYRWQWHHETDSRKSRAGFPDIIAAHPAGWLLLIELKGHDSRGRLGKVTPAQQQWVDTWNEAAGRIASPGVAAHVWTPADLRSGRIHRQLRLPARQDISKRTR